jgi:hypothetical protein
MQATLTYINKWVFAGVDTITLEADQRKHDYEDEYADFMDAFDRIAMGEDEDDGDMDPPQLSSAPSNHHQSGQQLDATETNPVPGPSRPRACRQAPPVTAAELDMAGELEDTADTEPKEVRQTERGRGRGCEKEKEQEQETTKARGRGRGKGKGKEKA